VFPVSHIGGHKFGGNMIVYENELRKATWYGRVSPCDIEKILEVHLNDKSVLEKNLRGVLEF